MQKNADIGNALKGLAEVQKQGQTQARGRPPVHLWNPPFCGHIDMRIAADGTWYYMNSPIGRKPLVNLFASILRRDGDDYVLVTPVEKCGITVDDAPFLAIRMMTEGTGRERMIRFETNVDDEVTLDAAHPMRVATEPGSGGLKPYVLIRDNLEALVARALFYDLVALGETHDDWFGVWSAGTFFPMQRASEIGLETSAPS